jgi:hypothetical protein
MTEAMEAVIDRWADDPTFRTSMRSDVGSALNGAGITLDEDLLAQLRAVDWTLSDQELEELLEKYRVWC